MKRKLSENKTKNPSKKQKQASQEVELEQDHYLFTASIH
jgi:hypothetical protein